MDHILEFAMAVGKLAWWEMDCVTGAVRFHRRKTDMLGYEPDGFRHYSDFAALLHPDDREPAMQAMRAHLEGTAQDYRLDYRIRNKAGAYLWFQDVGRISQRDAAGRPALVTGLVLDITERKLAEESLRESEEKLREMLENSLDAPYKRGLQSNSYLYVGPTFAKISGFTADEMKRMPIEEVLALMHPDDLAAVRSVMTEALSGLRGEAHQMEYRFKNKEGQYRWLLDQFVVMGDADGHPTAIIGSVRDITARRQVEEALKASEERFRNLFNGHAACMLIINPETGELLDANQAAATYYGWSIPELKAMNIRQINQLTPDDLEAELASAQGGSRDKFEFRHRRADGSVRDVEVYSNKIEIAGRPYLYSVIHDISDRKRAERALRASEQRFRTLAENMADTVWVMDDETERYQYISPAVVGLRGYSVEESMGFSVRETLPPENYASLRDIRKGRVQEFERGVERTYVDIVEQTHKNGSRVTVEVHGRFARNAESGRLEVIGVSRNITERKLAEEALAAAHDRLRHAEEFARFGHWEFLLEDRIIHASEGARKVYGLVNAEVPVAVVQDCALPEYRTVLDSALADLIERNLPYDQEFRIRRIPDGEIVHVHSKAEYDARTKTVFGVVQDISERKQIEEERERLIAELKRSIEQVKTLSGIVPICASCKKIRDDKGYWEQVEAYVSRHTEVQFSHSICPACMEKLYPDL